MKELSQQGQHRYPTSKVYKHYFSRHYNKLVYYPFLLILISQALIFLIINILIIFPPSFKHFHCKYTTNKSFHQFNCANQTFFSIFSHNPHHLSRHSKRAICYLDIPEAHCPILYGLFKRKILIVTCYLLLTSPIALKIKTNKN